MLHSNDDEMHILRQDRKPKCAFFLVLKFCRFNIAPNKYLFSADENFDWSILALKGIFFPVIMSIKGCLSQQISLSKRRLQIFLVEYLVGSNLEVIMTRTP